MFRSTCRCVWSALLAVLFFTAPVARAQAPVSYARQVKPFLARYCLECHNSQALKGELDLETLAAMRQGGKNGAVLVPGKPDESRLVLAVEGKAKPAMPPKKARQPTHEEAKVLRDWIAAGARDDSSLVNSALPAIAPRNHKLAAITALSYAPDGVALFAGRHKEVVRIAGPEVQRIAALSAPITALAVRPGGKLLAVAASITGVSGTVSLYALPAKSGSAPVRTLPAHADMILDIAFSPDGRLLATTGYDRLIKIWEVETGKLLHTLKDHSDAVYGLAFDPSGKLLASASADRAVKVWNVETGVRLYTLGDSTDWVYAVAWRPDGKQLAAAGVDKSIRTWDVSGSGGRLALSVFAHDGPIGKLLYSSDSRTLYSLGDDRVLKAWDASRLIERHVYAAQPELAQSFALRPDGKQAALGRFDGALVVLDLATGKMVSQPLPEKPKPPVISKASPDAGTRGQTVRVKLSGERLSTVSEIRADEPGLTFRKLSGAKSGEMIVDVTIPANARLGLYKLHVKSPAGVSAAVEFFVDRFRAEAYHASKSSVAEGALTLPVTVVGTLAEAGQVNRHVLALAAGQEVGVELTGARTKLDVVLRLLDHKGIVLDESHNGVLGFTAPANLKGVESFVLEVRDNDFRGNKDMGYRLHIGNIPVVTVVAPMGVQRGASTTIQVQGVHLHSPHSIVVRVPGEQPIGSRLDLPFAKSVEGPLGTTSVVVGEFPEIQMADSNQTMIPVPGVANGIIARPESIQTGRFQARKGQRLILEINARRLGSPLDSFVEVLDSQGKQVPRAVLRATGVTYVAFRDHDATNKGIRLETWNHLAIDDYLWVGDELLRIESMPRGPDDDCQFYGIDGKRIGFLGTTPRFHSQGAPLYQVQIHPPGKVFSPNGYPTVQLNYRNDDGGPEFGKDSRLIFDPPADGTYLVRVGDSCGKGGANYGYRLTIRPPEPRFTVQFTPEKPNVWKGGGTAIAVTATRLDDYQGPIHVRLEGLPTGFHASESMISAGQLTTALTLSADANAPEPAKGSMLKLVANATIQGKSVSSEKIGGTPKLIEPGDLTVATAESTVAVKPGDQVWATVKIKRRNGFKGRVPLEVRGLPHGVRVLDVGLNGIMITESETTRRVALFAEPWVEKLELPIVILARNEKKGTEIAARPVVLQVTGNR
jgi:WD40 repeat protein